MKSLLLIMSLLVSTAHAKFNRDGIKFIDTSGTSYLLREGQTAVIMLTDEAAKILATRIKQSPNSQLQCGEGYCSLGQISRNGQLTSLSGRFAEPNYFSKIVEMRANPDSLSTESYFEDSGSKSHTLSSQCQDEQLRRLPLEEVVIEGTVAERLYNFLMVPEGRGERVFGNGKVGHGDLFFCEKLPQMDHDDIDRNGVPLKGVPASYTEYRCYFKFSRDGAAQKRGDCRIYGSAISAGGN